MDSYQNRIREQPQQVVVNKHFSREDRIGETVRPRPLYYQWVGRKPLHEAIHDARYLGEVREEGRPCDAFLFLKAGYTGRQDRVYFLDKQTSLPVKVVTYLDSEARAQDRPLTVWQPTEIRQV